MTEALSFAEALAAHGEVAIWTDGACHPNPDGFGGWAAVLHVGDTRWELVGSEYPTTNNRMEMVAALCALEALGRQRKRVTLTSDSSYLVNAFSKGWLDGWIKSGRLRLTMRGLGRELVYGSGSLPNADLWDRLHAAAVWHDVTWIHIRGHGKGGVVEPENEACDRLAVAARKELRAQTEGVNT